MTPPAVGSLVRALEAVVGVELFHRSQAGPAGAESGVPFHAGLAKAAGASRDEVASAVLVGLQPAGHRVTAALPGALAGYDAA